jgi:hypothetical protein
MEILKRGVGISISLQQRSMLRKEKTTRRGAIILMARNAAPQHI